MSDHVSFYLLDPVRPVWLCIYAQCNTNVDRNSHVLTNIQAKLIGFAPDLPAKACHVQGIRPMKSIYDDG